MPKMKTNKGARKRFNVTGSGRVKFKKMHRRHLLTAKSQKRKRQSRQDGILTKADEANVKRLLPYE
jgi:large subunit ribosomal protein L35